MFISLMKHHKWFIMEVSRSGFFVTEMSIKIKDIIRINQQLVIAREKSKKNWYDSIVQGIAAKEFYIGMPYKKANPLVLYKGDKVKVELVAKNEKYRFNTTVIGRHFDNIPLYILAFPASYTRIQKRNFFRLPIMLPVSYAVVKEEDKKLQYIKTHTLDISGGGMRFLSKRRYEQDTALTLKMLLSGLNNDEEIKMNGKVIRAAEIPGVGYHISVIFTDIKTTVQEELIKYIIKETSRAKMLT